MAEPPPDTLTQLSIILGPFLNSNFITSLVGAGAGAWAGAYAAQKIAARSNQRNELLNEIRATIAGFNLAVMIFNVCFGLKKQHVKKLKEAYDEKKNEYLEVSRKRAAGATDLMYELKADFDALTPISVPVDKLQNIIIERVTNRRAVIFSSMLSQLVQSLNEALVVRNQLSEEFRASLPHSQIQLLQFYFGIPDHHGMIDNRYGGSIEAIYRYTDDCIFFSKSVADELSMHGKSLRGRFKKRFRGDVPTVGTLKIENKEHAILLPDPKEYSSWDGVPSK